MMKPPPVGTVRDGYRFNGGDPANPASWSRATPSVQSAETASWPANARVLPNNKVVAPNGRGGVVQLGDAVPNATEYAGKSAMFANLMTQAEQKLNEVGALEGTQARTPLDDTIIGDAAQFFGVRSKRDQQLEQAQNQWINAQLRLESGAAIPDSERANYRKTFMPVPNDTPEVIAQKIAARNAALQGMITTSEGVFDRMRTKQGKGSLDGATGPLAGVSPIRRPGGPQYKPPQRPRVQYTQPQMQALRLIEGGPRGAGGSRTNPTMVMNKAQFDKLPVGAWFIDNFGNYEQKVR